MDGSRSSFSLSSYLLLEDLGILKRKKANTDNKERRNRSDYQEKQRDIQADKGVARLQQKNKKTYKYYLVLDDPQSLDNKERIQRLKTSFPSCKQKHPISYCSFIHEYFLCRSGYIPFFWFYRSYTLKFKCVSLWPRSRAGLCMESSMIRRFFNQLIMGKTASTIARDIIARSTMLSPTQSPLS